MISFTYRLNGAGWASATISTPERTAQLTASYVLPDPLRDLVEGVLSLLNGEEMVRFRWLEEPAFLYWALSRAGARLDISITRFHRASLAGLSPGEEGEMIFHAECSLVSFAQQVLDQLERLLETHGVAGYNRQWLRRRPPEESGFPVEAYEHLREKLRRGSGSPALGS